MSIFAASLKSDPMDVNVGRKYRYTMLQAGGSQLEATTLENFVGCRIDGSLIEKVVAEYVGVHGQEKQIW